MMDYESMELDELKAYGKTLGLNFGNIGKAKLIEKIKEKETAQDLIAQLSEDDEAEMATEEIKQDEDKPMSLLEAVSSVIDDIEDAAHDEYESQVSLPLNASIPVKSITFGGLTYRSPSTHATFRWKSIGSVIDMTYAELIEMNNYKPGFLNKPRVILLDERAIKKFRLTDLYEKVAQINNLSKVFKRDRKAIETAIDTALAAGMRDILVSKIRQMITNRSLVDVSIIRLLENKLQFDFMDDIE